MLLLSTSSLRGYGLHKIFLLAAEAGFDGLNLDLSQGDYDLENPEYIRTLIDQTGFPVLSVTAYERRMGRDQVEKVHRVGEMLGAKIINFYPPHRSDREGSWFNDDLPRVKTHSIGRNVAVINVEPKTFLFFIPEYKDATLNSIKKITGETALSVANVDPETGVDLLKTYSLLGNSIRNVYLSDRSGTKRDLFPGKGDMPLESLLIKLRENGYKGAFTLRVSPRELGAGDDLVVLNKLAEAKKWYERYFLEKK